MQTDNPHFSFDYRGELRAAKAVEQNSTRQVGGVARHGFRLVRGVVTWIEADRCTPCAAEDAAAIEAAYEARMAADKAARRAAYLAKVA